jgi:hypothetical protein
VDGPGLLGRLLDRGRRNNQGRGRLPLELGDRAGGDRQPQQLGEGPLDLPLARPINAAEQITAPGLQGRDGCSMATSTAP